MVVSRSLPCATWRCLQDAYYPQHFFLRQLVTIVRMHSDAVVVAVIGAIVQGVAEKVAVGVVLQIADGFIFACNETDAVFAGI